jgi:hypothetical protein
MSEPSIRRIVVACDAVCAVGPAIETGAAIAAHWRASLHGLFVEDPALLQVAALPFTQQINLSQGISEALEPEHLERQLVALAGQARGWLETVARRRGLEWSFSVRREDPASMALTADEADLLILQATARPVGGQFQLDSRWLAAAYDAPQSVLLLRDDDRPGGPIVVPVDAASAGARRAVAAAAEMAGMSNRPIILLAGAGAPAEAEMLGWIRDVSPPAARRCRVEPLPAAVGDLAERVARLDGRLLVLNADLTESDKDRLRAIASSTRCNVLLVR